MVHSDEPLSGRTRDGVCPFSIEKPIMLQRWERLTFVHWRFEPSVVQSLLPDGLVVETFDDVAWVGLVPFYMHVLTSGGHGAPWLSRFCETNVRTYVRDEEGRSGIWFFSLDAERLAAVVTARTTYRLPYFWASMRLDEDAGMVSYSSRRLGLGGAPATSRLSVSVGAPFAADELSERDHFLTARWTLFSVHGRRFRFARAAHEPWPLHRAELLDLDDDLIESAGLPHPTGDAVVHFSHGVDVRIGMPERR